MKKVIWIKQFRFKNWYLKYVFVLFQSKNLDKARLGFWQNVIDSHSTQWHSLYFYFFTKFTYWIRNDLIGDELI